MLLYIVIIALIAWILHEVKIEDSASASEQSITLNLQDFQPSESSQETEEIPEISQEIAEEETQTDIGETAAEESAPADESHEAQTKKLFEKIAQAAVQPVQEIDQTAPLAQENKKKASIEELQALTKKLLDKIAKADKVKKTSKKKPEQKKLKAQTSTRKEEALEKAIKEHKQLLAEQATEKMIRQRRAKALATDTK